jgi:Sulfotransferase family
MATICRVLTNFEELDDPIFVVGCPRSGTTVLARAIGLAESVCYTGETKVIPKFYNRRVPITQAIAYWVKGEPLLPILKGKARSLQEKLLRKDYLKELIPDLIKYAKVREIDLRPINSRVIEHHNVSLTPEEIDLAHGLWAKYRKIGKRHPEKLIRIMFKDFQLLSQKDKILEKTPAHAFSVVTLKRIFPRSKFCFISRNGRDVAASYMLNFRSKKTDNRTIRYICRTYTRIRSVDEKLSTTVGSSYYRVRYEELIARPTVVLREIFDFLELPFSPHVLSALSDVKSTSSKWELLPDRTKSYVDTRLGLGSKT